MLFRSPQRSRENLETHDKIKALGREVDIVVCDLAVEADVKSVAKKVTGPKSEGGLGLDIDILLNCGGIQRRWVLSILRWAHTLTLELLGPPLRTSRTPTGTTWAALGCVLADRSLTAFQLFRS